MLRKDTSVATLAIVTLVAVATLLLGILGIINYVSESNDQRAALAAEAATMGSQLSAALALPLWNFDRPQIDRVLDSALQAPDVYAVVIRQPDVTAPDGVAQFSRSRDSGKPAVASGGGADLPAFGLLMKETSIVASGEPVGTVKVLLTTQNVEHRLRNSLFLLAARIIGLDLLLILSLYILLRRTVLLPLRAVERYASAVSSGDVHAWGAGRPQFSGEIESLRASVEKMIVLLDERYAALEKSEEQYRLLFEKSLAGIAIFEVICDTTGHPTNFRLVQANPAVDRLTGLRREREVGRTREELGFRWPIDLERKLLDLGCNGGDLAYERFNESLQRHYKVQAFSPKKGQFALVFYDLTEQKRGEAALLESEKLRTVAGLAAGMAHEINNPLAGMLQNAQVALNRLSADTPANRRAAEEAGTSVDAVEDYVRSRGILEMLQMIRAAGERAAGIVSNMLSFSRVDAGPPELHELAELLDRALDLARGDYDLRRNYDFRNIQVVTEYAAGLPGVPCRASEIQQVVLNLLTNAAQAMADRNPGADPPRIVLRTLRDRGFARIEIEDNGPGVPEDVRRRMFEPFFTTKGPQAGTGLGLFVAYFIITRNHGGSITVESQVDVGTKFTIRLPLRADDDHDG